MKIEALHIGMTVQHPQYGLGTVKAISALTADIQFNEGLRTVSPEASELKPAEAQADISGLTIPLAQLIDRTVSALADRLGFEKPDAVVEELGTKWQRGTMVLRPADPTLQVKELPLETFFHKIVMMRNNFRVLEQKINSHPSMTDAEKFELQQYISRCYGSMTTFNVLFKQERDQFRSKA
jgi:hypothetical protein